MQNLLPHRYFSDKHSTLQQPIHEVWNKLPLERGVEIHQILEKLRKNAKTIDCMFTLDPETRMVVSIKSLDLRAKTYLDPSKLHSRLKKYVDKLAEYKGEGLLDRYRVKPHHIQCRVLELVLPHIGTFEQERVIKQIAEYSKLKGVMFSNSFVVE